MKAHENEQRKRRLKHKVELVVSIQVAVSYSITQGYCSPAKWIGIWKYDFEIWPKENKHGHMVCRCKRHEVAGMDAFEAKAREDLTQNVPSTLEPFFVVERFCRHRLPKARPNGPVLPESLSSLEGERDFRIWVHGLV